MPVTLGMPPASGEMMVASVMRKLPGVEAR